MGVITDKTGLEIVGKIGDLNVDTSGLVQDTTAQAIKASIDALAAVVKPDASEIPYDSNLSVKDKIDELSEVSIDTTGVSGFQIMKNNKIVTIDGNGIFGGSYGVVPSGYRPNRIRYISCIVNTGTNYYNGYLTITSAGVISGYYIDSDTTNNITNNTAFRVFVMSSWLVN